MNAYANRNKLAVVLLTVLTVFASAAILAADASDADDANLNNFSSSDFYSNKDGTLTIPSTLGDIRTVKITVEEESHQVAYKVINNVPETSTSVSISFSLGEGYHYLVVKIDTYTDSTMTSNVYHNQSNYELNVKKDIWSSVGTYIALVIVAIVIIAIVVIYMRAKPNNKPTTTFTQLEEEKKAAAAAPEKEKAAPKTEKIKYTSSRRK